VRAVAEAYPQEWSQPPRRIILRRRHLSLREQSPGTLADEKHPIPHGVGVVCRGQLHQVRAEGGLTEDAHHRRQGVILEVNVTPYLTAHFSQLTSSTLLLLSHSSPPLHSSSYLTATLHLLSHSSPPLHSSSHLTAHLPYSQKISSIILIPNYQHRALHISISTSRWILIIKI